MPWRPCFLWFVLGITAMPLVKRQQLVQQGTEITCPPTVSPPTQAPPTALPQVLQLTERLQQLKDAQLPQVLHQQLLAEASRAARDRQLAAAIGDRQDEGPSGRQVEALAQSLPTASSLC